MPTTDIDTPTDLLDASTAPPMQLVDSAADPNRIAAAARLYGMPVPDVARVRMLVIGPGSSADCLAVLAAWPAAACVAVELDAARAAQGRAFATAGGMRPPARILAGVFEIDDRAEEFDVIVLRDVGSWAAQEQFASVLEYAARLLAPTGLLVGAAAALPGWWLWTAERDLLTIGADLAGPITTAQVAAARELLQLAADLADGVGVHGQLLRASVERADSRSDADLLRDELSPSFRPLALDELADIVAPHGLAFVGEARPQDWWETNPAVADRVRAGAGDDPVRAQCLADLVAGPETKVTMFARADHAQRRLPLLPDAARAAVAVRGRHADAWAGHEHPTVAAVLAAVDAAGPIGAPFATVAVELGISVDDVAATAVALATHEAVVLLELGVPAAVAVPELPAASALARAQARAIVDGGGAVTTLAHGCVELAAGSLELAVLPLLDGSRDIAALAGILRAEPSHESVRHDDVAASLERLAAAALLVR